MSEVIQRVAQRIDFARSLTLDLLQNTPDEKWFQTAGPGLTHIAWQVGHIGVAQYSLALKRRRGERPEDAQLIPSELLTMYGKGSQPDPDPANNPTPDQLRDVCAAVHAQVLKELAEITEEGLDEPLEPPHPMFKTKLHALQFCPDHELLHTGQIALLRRIVGEQALR